MTPRKLLDLILLAAKDNEEEYATSNTSAALAEKFIKDLRHAGTIDEVDPFTVVASDGSLWVYSFASGQWLEVPNEVIESVIYHYDGKWWNQGTREGLIAIKQRPTGAVRGVHINQRIYRPNFFNDAPLGVPTRSGFVTIKNGEVVNEVHDASHKSRYILPFDHDPEAECPEWEKFLGEVFEGDEDSEQKQMALQEFIGACLAGTACQYEKAFILLGEGANGKSIFQEVIESLFPDDAVSCVTPQEMKHEYYRININGKLINVVDETPSDRLFATDLFKRIITGRPVIGRNPHQSTFNFSPKCGHLFAANDLPQASDTSEGFWRRFVVVQFNRDFSRSNVARQTIVDKLKADLPGVLNWALRGLIRLQEQGHYTQPESTHEVQQQWKEESDSVTAWMAQRMELSPDNTPQFASDLHIKYRGWCDSVGLKPVAINQFGKRLRRYIIQEARRQAYTLDSVTGAKAGKARYRVGFQTEH